MSLKRPLVRLFISRSNPSEIALSIELDRCFLVLATGRCGNPFKQESETNPFIKDGVKIRFIWVEKNDLLGFMTQYQMQPTTLTYDLYHSIVWWFKRATEIVPYWLRFREVKTKYYLINSETVQADRRYKFVRNGVFYDATIIPKDLKKTNKIGPAKILAWVRHFDNRIFRLASEILYQFIPPATVEIGSKRKISCSELKNFQFFQDNEGYTSILYKGVYLFEQALPKRGLTEKVVGDDQIDQLNGIEWSLSVCEPDSFKRCADIELGLFRNFRGGYIERVDIRTLNKLEILKIDRTIYFKIKKMFYRYDRFLLTHEPCTDLVFRDMKKVDRGLIYKTRRIPINRFIETFGEWVIMVHRDICLSEFSPLPKSFVASDMIMRTISEIEPIDIDNLRLD